jgi:hypothetical protein
VRWSSRASTEDTAGAASFARSPFCSCSDPLPTLKQTLPLPLLPLLCIRLHKQRRRLPSVPPLHRRHRTCHHFLNIFFCMPPKGAPCFRWIKHESSHSLRQCLRGGTGKWCGRVGLGQGAWAKEGGRKTKAQVRMTYFSAPSSVECPLLALCPFQGGLPCPAARSWSVVANAAAASALAAPALVTSGGPLTSASPFPPIGQHPPAPSSTSCGS